MTWQLAIWRCAAIKAMAMLDSLAAVPVAEVCSVALQLHNVLLEAGKAIEEPEDAAKIVFQLHDMLNANTDALNVNWDAIMAKTAGCCCSCS